MSDGQLEHLGRFYSMLGTLERKLGRAPSLTDPIRFPHFNHLLSTAKKREAQQ